MARRRFQRGSLFLRGTRVPVWVGRWREDVVVDGRVVRVSRKEVLGTKKDFPTQRLAWRELESRLAPINSPCYRAQRRATFAEFVAKWERDVLANHKPSTQSAARSVLRCWLIPHFGPMQMREITAETVQRFVTSCPRSPKTCRNFVLMLKMIWKTAKVWQYVTMDPFEDITLPRAVKRQRMFFTVDEVSRILAAAEEPQKTFYWLAAETGLRAGELCGLRIEDLDFATLTIRVRQSVWQGRVQTPKTDNARREFAISPQLAQHLNSFLRSWRPNSANLLFATKVGTAWTPCNLMRAKLHPLLDSLNIKRCGLHAFRHTNGSLMDRLNTPIKVRQERLGHAPGSDVTMTVYTHSVTDDDRKVAGQLGQILCPTLPNSQSETVDRMGYPMQVQ